MTEWRLPGALGRVRDGVQRRWGSARNDRQLLAAIIGALPPGPSSVVLLNAPEPGRLTDGIRSSHPEAVVHNVTGTNSERHVRLTLLGPVDAIVDERPGPGQAKRFLASFYQLHPGGAMILRDWRENGGKLSELLDAARAAKGQPYPSNKRGIPLAALDAHGLGSVLESTTEVGHHLLAVTHGGPILAKLREDEMNRYLAGLPAGGDCLLEVIPAEPFVSRCTFQENGLERRAGFPERYETIDISLRLYHDVVATPGQVLSNDRVIAPESYRHNQFPRLRNRATQEVAPRFARLRHPSDNLPYLAGTYFHLDNEMRGHFGHLMTEQLSRLWAWPKAQAAYPGIKALVAINKGRELRAWELEVYAAAGIAEEDVVFLDGPVRVERMVAATPMLSNPDYVHPGIIPTWRMVGDNLARTAPARDLPRRFFCSRRLAKRSCHNTDEVERLFAAQGFAIVYPEDYSLGEQVRLFRGADVIAGFVGSALFTLCYVMDPKRVILVGSTTYTARNEYLIASVLGHRIDSVACVPDDPTFYQSPFRFDPLQEGDFLAGVFASL